MSEFTSPFYDERLIYYDGFEPLNFAHAEIETKTYVWLLAHHLKTIRISYSLKKAVEEFFDCYDDAMIKIAEVEGYATKHEITDSTNITNERLYWEERKYSRTHDPVMRRERLIYNTLRAAQKEFFKKAIEGGIFAFEDALKETTKELRERANYLYELMPKD